MATLAAGSAPTTLPVAPLKIESIDEERPVWTLVRLEGVQASEATAAARQGDDGDASVEDWEVLDDDDDVDSDGAIEDGEGWWDLTARLRR